MTRDGGESGRELFGSYLAAYEVHERLVVLD
jgi:hypothetical protein